MADINVVNESLTRSPKIQRVDVKTPEATQETINTEVVSPVSPKEEQPQHNNVQPQETSVDWDEASITTPLVATNFDESRSMADTWVRVFGEVEEQLGTSNVDLGQVDWTGIPQSPKPKGALDYGKEAVAGIVEWPVNTAKIIPSLAIWGGALSKKIGGESLGNIMSKWGAETMSNLNFSLQEFGMDVDREGITYQIAGVAPDIITAIGLSKAAARKGSKLLTKAVEEEAAHVKTTGRASESVLEKGLFSSPKANALKESAEKWDKVSRYSPFAFMMGKDVGSMNVDRMSQYVDLKSGELDTENLMNNFWKETGAVATYGVISTLIEKYTGIGLIMKRVPAGVDITLDALKASGDIIPNYFKNKLGLTFIGLSVLKEGFTESLQEGTQSLTELVYKLPTRGEDGELSYQSKTFQKELQRILLAGVIGGVIGGGMSWGHVHNARNLYVERVVDKYTEMNPKATKKDIDFVTQKAKESFNQTYVNTTTDVAKELKTENSFLNMSGEEYEELTQHISEQLQDLGERGFGDLDPLYYTQWTREIATVMSNVLGSKGVPLSDFTDHLDIEVADVNGIKVIQATWAGVPIFRPTEHMINPNERYEEDKYKSNQELLSKYKQVSVGNIKRRKGLSLEILAELPERGKVWVEKETNTIVTDPSVRENLDIAHDYITTHPLPTDYNIAVEKMIKASARGGFDPALGAIFINPRIADSTTISHELGHLYTENMYAAYKNGMLTPEMQKQFGDFLSALGVDVSLPHLKTRDSELIADVFSAVGTNSEILGQANKILKGSSVEKAIQGITEDFKKHAIRAFNTINHKGVQVTPAVQSYVQDVLGINPKSINTTTVPTDKVALAQETINNLPQEEGYNRELVEKAILEDNINSLPDLERTIAKDAKLSALIDAKDREGIVNFARENYFANREDGSINSVADNLNNAIAQQVEMESAITGKTVEEIVQDKILFQRLVPNEEGIEKIQQATNLKDYAILNLWDVATNLRYGSMLGSASTFSLSAISGIVNTAAAKVVDTVTGRFKGVKNLVSEDIHSQCMEMHKDRFKTTGLANSFVGASTEQLWRLSQKTSAKYKGKGESFINLANKIGRYASTTTTALPDHMTKTPYSQYTAEMAASKIAQEKGLNANEILLDSLRNEPLTPEGLLVRQEAQGANRDVEFLPSGDGNTIGEAAIKAFNKGLDGVLSVIPDPEIKAFVKSAVLPFNGIACGIAARTINGMVGLPYEGLKAAIDAIKARDASVFVKAIRGMDRRYATDSILALVAAGALDRLLGEDDYMPPYDLATSAQRKAANKLNIPFDSIRIGGVWISSEYCGIVHTAVRLLPTLRAIRDGKPREAWGEYVKNVVQVIKEAPVTGLFEQDLAKVVSPEAMVDKFNAYLKSYIPRVGKDLYKVITQEDNYFNPLTGTKETQQPYMQFIFGSRARLFTEDQALALNVVNQGINIMPTIKKDITPELAINYSNRYNKLIHSPRLRTMSAEEIKKAFANIKREALKATTQGSNK